MSVNLTNNNALAQPSETSKPTYLDPSQGPDDLDSSISYAFEKLVKNSSSQWGFFNGSNSYENCRVDEYALLRKIIQQAPEEQKDFYALDIGCGNFQWVKGVAEYIEKLDAFPKDKKVHIIGIRGERNLDAKTIETDRCKLYFLGAFKIEELFKSFKAEGLDLENKIDLAVSSWCLRHLVNPVRTFAQLYNLLRPKTGFALIDGFFFLDEKGTLGDLYENARLTQLFLDTKAPFLTRYFNGMRSLNHFMLQRPDARPCQLPMSYLDYRFAGEGWQIGSNIVTVYKRESQESDKEGFFVPSCEIRDSNHMYGEKKMHEWLKKNGLLTCPDTVWRPIQKKDEHQKTPLLHYAVEMKRIDLVNECLKAGDDIDESDFNGNTPLHSSIEALDFEIFELLLKNGANLQLPNGSSCTPLHTAAIHDKEGRFITALIERKANIEENFSYKKTPLQCALHNKNVKGVEILIRARRKIRAEAKISHLDYIDLEDPAFSSLHKQGLIPPQTGSGGLADIYSWIKRGDCVVLHYNGVNGIMYNYPNPENHYPVVIYVDVDPSTNLLDEEEWPYYLEGGGYEFAPYDVEVIKKSKFERSYDYSFPARKHFE